MKIDPRRVLVGLAMAGSLVITPPAAGYAMGALHSGVTTHDHVNTGVFAERHNDNDDQAVNDNAANDNAAAVPVAPADAGAPDQGGGTNSPNNQDQPGNGGTDGGGGNDSSPGSY